MVGILGKKIGMTQIFKDEQTLVPATVIEAGPCSVLQIKTKERDGYDAIQLGFGNKNKKNTSSGLKGHFAKSKSEPQEFIRELRLGEGEKFELGQRLTAEVFLPGDIVDITGNSIGRGFQGGVKKWGWKGGSQTHGSTSHRRPGSIGSSSDPSRVFKGRHLPGRMGNKKTTVQNVEILDVDKENNLLVVKGSLPGHKNSYLLIRPGLKKQKVKPKNLQAQQKKKGGAKKAAPAAAKAAKK